MEGSRFELLGRDCGEWWNRERADLAVGRGRRRDRGGSSGIASGMNPTHTLEVLWETARGGAYTGRIGLALVNDWIHCVPAMGQESISGMDLFGARLGE